MEKEFPLFEKTDLVVGERQVTKELKKGGLNVLYLAQDADLFFVEKLKKEAGLSRTPVITSFCGAQLAQLAKVDVFTGAVGVLGRPEEKT